MSEIGNHIVMRLKDNRVLASTSQVKRTLARIVLEKAKPYELLAFGLADTHLHLLACCPKKDAGELARRVEISLALKLLNSAVGFARAFVEPVFDNRHLKNSFSYILNQTRHHGLKWDPLMETTNLPDLLGLRLLGRYTVSNVKRSLPRLNREMLLEYFGIKELKPFDDPVEQVVEAGMAAAGLPELKGKSREVTDMRRAVITVAAGRLNSRMLANRLGIGRSAFFRLSNEPANPLLIEAIRLQLGLMTAIARNAMESPVIE